MKSNITVGFLAHVDAGKTTLTEGILFNSGMIRKLGRVDHQNAFLDNDPMERDRGITIFSKQARIIKENRTYTLIDTPGHGELTPETERTLRILDYCILLISAADGVTGHTTLLWKMLEHYGVPVFIFVNKMDRPDADKEQLFEELKNKLSTSCIDFGTGRESDDFYEQIALSGEDLLERFLQGEKADDKTIALQIRSRKIFPVLFGSALKGEGIAGLLECIDKYMIPDSYPDSFSAMIYKISRDNKGARLAWMKITGGILKVKMPIIYEKNGVSYNEKPEQIRLYSGERFENAQAAHSGSVCAVTGLSGIRAGDVLGKDDENISFMVEPILTYEIINDEKTETIKVLEALKLLEEEEPKLHIRFSEKTGRISIQLMGRVQMEVVQRQMKERFGINIEFGSRTVVYKETIKNTVEGVGHFEPLRHYAEVHVKMEPLPAGSGIKFENACHRDYLDPHWQRLVMAHFHEKTHTGVLTGSELTDMKISLISGRAHEKHTESGDFRQAAFRAIRQGLMEAVSVLLEPYFDFVLNVPESVTGRALYDLDQMGARIEPPEVLNGITIIKGSAPASGLGSYQEQVTVYTSGEGRLFCTFKGYEPCHNAEEVMENIGYDPAADTENPSFSVFCSHGAGIIVPWYNVKEKMHVEAADDLLPVTKEPVLTVRNMPAAGQEREEDFKEAVKKRIASENELKEIFEKTYGSKNRAAHRPGWKNRNKKPGILSDPAIYKAGKPKIKGSDYLLVDGYNIIFAWEELKNLAEADIGAARDKLIDILCDYHGTKDGELILVFDAYKVPGGTREVIRHHNIFVVYTKQSETADQYIEKTVHEIAKKHEVTVATSDALEQMIILGEGASRLSAAGLYEAVARERAQIKEDYMGTQNEGRSTIGEIISQEVKDAIDE